jgi:hypothetical protein
MPTSLSKKLDPARFPGTSPLMAAIVGYVLGESCTEPTIAELTVSEQEDLVYIRQEGAVRFDYLMLQRNLLYTAVVRGKKLVVLVGTKKALGLAVRRQDTSRRYTALRKRLADDRAKR